MKFVRRPDLGQREGAAKAKLDECDDERNQVHGGTAPRPTKPTGPPMVRH
jgi:hypothetical protein